MMFRSSRSKTLTFIVLAAVAALFSAALVVARQKQERRQARTQESSPADASARAAALRSPDALKRAAAAYEISERPREAKALIGELVELLGDATMVDPNSYRNREKWSPNTPVTVGMEAARALTSAEGEAVEPLIAALSRKEAEARKNAAWALGAIGNQRAVMPLTETLRHDDDSNVREQAAWALGAVGDRRAVAGLSAALADANPEVQQQAAWALGAIGAREAAPALGAALKARSAEVRTQAAWALGAIGDRRAVDVLHAWFDRARGVAGG